MSGVQNPLKIRIDMGEVEGTSDVKMIMDKMLPIKMHSKIPKNSSCSLKEDALLANAQEKISCITIGIVHLTER